MKEHALRRFASSNSCGSVSPVNSWGHL